ncbi:MAG: aminotransferase class I/II-fold pyridoxal phosphate-dependent enzyme [Actinomycetota bacterium]
MRERSWVPAASESFVQEIAQLTVRSSLDGILESVDAMVDENRRIHDECVQLNPAANAMNPRAEALLSAGLGSRPSLGYPGDKYEMGLEAVERIEVMAAELACRVFGADFAEVRVGSGGLANLYVFMAVCSAGDAVVVPPAEIGGHVTHHVAGAAGLYGLDVHEAPVDADLYTVDVEALAAVVERLRPRLMTIGGSLNLRPHPVGAIREIADSVGAVVMFDAAHLAGLIAGGAWPNPLDEGAHVMTMSTYKSLGGPPQGLVVTNDAALAERIDRIAHPGLTANFDLGNTAALAVSLVDTLRHGEAYAVEMVSSAGALQSALVERGVDALATESHAFAVRTDDGHGLAKRLRQANFLTSGIGVPAPSSEGVMNGLRIGTNEIVRWGMTAADMDELAGLIEAAIRSDDPSSLASNVTRFRRRFDRLHFVG